MLLEGRVELARLSATGCRRGTTSGKGRRPKRVDGAAVHTGDTMSIGSDLVAESGVSTRVDGPDEAVE